MNEKKVPRLINDERGASMFEYALLVSLIALVSITSVSLAGERTRGTFVEVGIVIAGTNNPGGQVSDP